MLSHAEQRARVARAWRALPDASRRKFTCTQAWDIFDEVQDGEPPGYVARKHKVDKRTPMEVWNKLAFSIMLEAFRGRE